MRDKVLVTGANGNLGKKFILSKGDFDICALVRSEKAKNDLMSFVQAKGIQDVQIVKCDYLNVSLVKELASSCSYVLHLVGIIKENKHNKFDLVHKQTTKAVVEAINGSDIKKTCYISILGSKVSSRNTCFSSRGLAEKLFIDSDIPSPASGIILEIIAQVNDTVPVGDVIAKIGEADEQPDGPSEKVVEAPGEPTSSSQPILDSTSEKKQMEKTVPTALQPVGVISSKKRFYSCVRCLQSF